MPQSVIRAEDGTEWETWEKAKAHEKRRSLIKKKLEELGGFRGLHQVVSKEPDAKRTKNSFYENAVYTDSYYDEACIRHLAIETEEIARLAEILYPVFEESGPNPRPLKD
jgi:hypothetical protein